MDLQVKMYDPIFSKSFNGYQRKRFGCCGLVLCFIIAFTFSSSFNPHSLGYLKSHLSDSIVEDTILSEELVVLNINETGNENHINETGNENHINETGDENLSINETRNENLNINETSNENLSINEPSYENERTQGACRVLEANADYCDFEGDIRVDSGSSTVFIKSSYTKTWVVQPYPRKGIPFVRNWTVSTGSNDAVPECSKTHTVPAILFSLGGFSGNHFHDFADLIVPLFITSYQFKSDVHFLATDYKSWWPAKYRNLLNRLTKHDIVDIDHEKSVHCYNRITLGLKFHRELIINPSAFDPSMSRFRELLRETYSLKRKEAIKWRRGARPRLMIISRKKTRIITNEAKIHRAARRLGYEVVVAEGETSGNLTEFAEKVNSCDVMMGIHGAGLTNMIFLPDNAVLIQVVPLGGIDIFAKLDFGNPSGGMKIRYLEHKIEMEESSLIQQYGHDNPVITDPKSIHRKGWNHIREIYLDNQNVTIDVPRFKRTLSKALKLLRH